MIQFKTAVGEAAAARRTAGETGRQKGQGEAAIAELLARLDEITRTPDDPVLLLYEDSDVVTKRFVLPGNVHLLSTKAFLIGLERRGFIASAEEVWAAIEAAGRMPAPRTRDQPAAGGSRW